MPEKNCSDTVLPNFLLIGAQKAGTTALSKFLRQHLEICFSRPKETWFFSRNYNRGIEWFASHFEHYEGETAIGEGSTVLSSPEAPERIASHLPNVQLICILRNPIERAFSQYHYYLYTGNVVEIRAFGEVIRDESSEFGRDLIDRGRYIRHLRRYEKYFSRDQIKVVFHRALRNDAQNLLRHLYEVIGVDSSFIPDTKNQSNVTKYPSSRMAYALLRKGWKTVSSSFDRWMPVLADTLRGTAREVLFDREKPEIKDEDRAYLKDLYKPYNRELERWLGTDLSHWK
ncbi:sulfotransferase domain-containing protein [Salinibacter ruber]|uniref:sulfotransferase domain-containing protein n=1 Tax=Salinibacter ruber TaxID=146919 RepID=UPI00161689EE|nr:sulfotransferase domain-containing protein [Salinibacter ruber]MBB4062401.1 hypothetical protein [Salinibacter ruber]